MIEVSDIFCAAFSPYFAHTLICETRGSPKRKEEQDGQGNDQANNKVDPHMSTFAEKREERGEDCN